MTDHPREQLKIVIVGHVDHGKSTLIGRLFHDTGSLPEGKLEAIQEMCHSRGMPFEWAFLMDAFQAERDQGVSIDSAQIWFRTKKRDYVIIDAPGHKEFLKNMVTGAASGDAALLVIDADEGVREQSRRHGYLLHMLGVRQVIVVVNKMDLVDFGEERFQHVRRECTAYLSRIGVTPGFVIPVSARQGDNVVSGSDNMPWYDGPGVVEALDHFHNVTEPADLPLRFPVQDVYKFDERRIVAGRVESGVLRVGDTLLFSPSNKTARVARIEAWGGAPPPSEVHAGRSAGVTLDEQIFVERGELASHLEDPPIETDVFRAQIFWLGSEPLTTGGRYTLKLHTCESPVTVQSIEKVIDTDDLSSRSARAVERNAVAEVVLRVPDLLALDPHPEGPRTGRFVLVENYQIVGGGIVSMEGYADQRSLVTVRAANVTRSEHHIDGAVRAQRNRHQGGVVWFTGLSGAGKSTLALEVERRLFQEGYQVYVLDGDNLRHGLNANLGFSPEDRAENIRRVGEVAALFARAGMVAVSAFISPYRSDRERARRAAGGKFHEIYIKADVDTCAERDPKGLYKRARAGEIKEFTGVSAPYEEPEDPELVVDTTTADVETCVIAILDYVRRNFTMTAD